MLIARWTTAIFKPVSPSARATAAARWPGSHRIAPSVCSGFHLSKLRHSRTQILDGDARRRCCLVNHRRQSPRFRHLQASRRKRPRDRVPPRPRAGQWPTPHPGRWPRALWNSSMGHQRTLGLVVGRCASSLVGDLAVHPVEHEPKRRELHCVGCIARAVQGDVQDGARYQIGVGQRLDFFFIGGAGTLRRLNDSSRPPEDKRSRAPSDRAHAV